MKALVRRLLRGRPSEEARLITRAAAFPRHTPTTIRYRNLVIRVTDLLSVAWQIKEFFGDERMRFPSDKSDPLIIDCGSNVGVSVLYFRSIHPAARIICFEPDPAVHACLEENLRANGITDVDHRRQAVWVHGEGVSFGSEGADGGSILRSENAVRLPSVRLREVLQEAGEIDLLKIDIEGAEVPVLLDCADELHRVKQLYVEYHSLPDAPQQLHELLEVLNRAGFRYYIDRIGVHHRRPFMAREPAAMDLQLDIHAVRD